MIMKKIIFALIPMFLVLNLIGCNDRLEGDEITNVDVSKIDSVMIAQDTMDVFSVQTIKTYSTYTSKCEGFYGYDYVHTSASDRRVTTYKFKTEAACGDMVTRASQINFRPQQTGTYYFKFWTGKNAAGENTWLEKMILVH